MGRGKGLRKADGCMIQTAGYEEMVQVEYSKKGNPPYNVCGFHYPALVEYECDDDFLSDLIELAQKSDDAHLPVSIRHTEIEEPSFIERENCKNCDNTGKCKFETAFNQHRVACFNYTMKKCPVCYCELTPTRTADNKKTLHDVRLAGYPTVLCLTPRYAVKCTNPRCKKKDHQISGMRIPFVEASTQSDWSLRLLISCLDLSTKGIAPRVLAEGYALKEDSVRKRIRQLSNDLKKQHEKRLGESLPLLRTPLQKEQIRLGGKSFWAVFENNRLYHIFSDKDVQKMDSFLGDLAPNESSTSQRELPSPILALCTFAGIGEHRANLATMEYSLLYELSKESPEYTQDSDYSELADLLLRTLVHEEIPLKELSTYIEGLVLNRKSQRWMRQTPGNRYRQVMHIAKRIIQYLHKNRVWARAEYSGNHNPDFPVRVTDYQWYPTNANRHPLERNSFIQELECISARCEYTAEEQISRLLYLNQAALTGREEWLAKYHPNQEYVGLDFSNEENLTIPHNAKIGWGIKTDCLRYMLAHGLLDANNGIPILCVLQDLEGRFTRNCDCEECPLNLEAR